MGRGRGREGGTRTSVVGERGSMRTTENGGRRRREGVVRGRISKGMSRRNKSFPFFSFFFSFPLLLLFLSFFEERRRGEREVKSG